MSNDTMERAFTYYPQLRKVKQYVEANYMESICLERAASVAGMERTYFSTFFHKKVGVCFWAWLTHLRIEHAKAIFASEDRSIINVAMEVGFENINTFDKAFKKVTGVTPKQFKQGVRPS